MMLLQRWSPVQGFDGLRREIDGLFQDFGGPFNGGFFRAPSFPAVNVWEDGECVYAEAEIPGVTMQDVEVSVIGDELCIKGIRKAMHEGNYTFHRQERGTAEFSRFLTLPTPVNADKVEAVLKNGVLTVTMPKAEDAKPKRIEVKTR